MSAKKVNKQHPAYSEYIKKCRAVFDAYREFEEKEYAKYPRWAGRDHPSYAITIPEWRKRNAQLKELQKEYAYLWEPSEEE